MGDTGHNSKLKKGAKLSPSQQVKGNHPEPSPKDDTAEPGSTNRLKQLGAQAREKSEKVINQHTFLVLESGVKVQGAAPGCQISVFPHTL